MASERASLWDPLPKHHPCTIVLISVHDRLTIWHESRPAMPTWLDLSAMPTWLDLWAMWAWPCGHDVTQGRAPWRRAAVVVPAAGALTFDSFPPSSSSLPPACYNAVWWRTRATIPSPSPLTESEARHSSSSPPTPESGDSRTHGEQKQEVSWGRYSRRVILSTILSRSDGGLGLVGERVVVGGWVKSCKEIKKKEPSGRLQVAAVPEDVTCSEVLMSRIPLLRSIARALFQSNGHSSPKSDAGVDKAAPSVAYLRLNDGSCVASLQIVIDSSLSPLGQLKPIGTSILVEGVLKQPSVPGKHGVELEVERIQHVGIIDSNKYPFGKKRLSFDFIRVYPHLRPRISVVSSIARIHNCLYNATNAFFQDNGFLHVHMPVITTTTLGGDGKRFLVTTLFNKSESKEAIDTTNDGRSPSLEVIKTTVKEKSKRIEELKRSDSNKEALAAAIVDLKKANELASQLERCQKLTSETSLKTDFSKDFFHHQAYLHNSSRLHLESYACSLGSVYTFAPVFLAEKSSTRHLAEMWMVEVELAFAELEDVINCAEDYLKFLCQWVLEKCSDDTKSIAKRMDKNCIDRLQSVGAREFERITYTEAVEALKKVEKKTFDTEVEWGTTLSEEHESYLADNIYKCPVIIYDHPKEVKPFNVRLKDDGKTVSSFDIIFPKVGALVRGDQKEEHIDKISDRIEELGLPREDLEWYLDLCRHGTLKHSGFSLRFEHLVVFTTGVDDIRDVIPFPRTYGNANP